MGLPASWWSWWGRKKWGEGCEGPPGTGCISAVPSLSSKPSTWQLNGRLSKIYRRLGRNPASQGVSWWKQKNWQISLCETYPFLSQSEALFSQQTPTHLEKNSRYLFVWTWTRLPSQRELEAGNPSSLYVTLLLPFVPFSVLLPFFNGCFSKMLDLQAIVVSWKWVHLQG